MGRPKAPSAPLVVLWLGWLLGALFGAGVAHNVNDAVCEQSTVEPDAPGGGS